MKSVMLRQAFILTGLFLCSISEGFIFGQMSGMVAAMESDVDLTLTSGEISWIASTINVTSVFGFALAGIVTELMGRKHAISLLTTPILANWIILYYATDFSAFMLSRIIVGVCFGGVLFLVFISTSEYTSPNIRGLCLNIMSSVGTSVGAAIARLLSSYLHWRTVALLGIIPTTLSGLLPWFWVESPHWLASKGKFEECRKSFKALHGHRGEEAEKELQQLIELEKFKINKISKNPESARHIYKCIKQALKQWYFWKLSVLMIFIHVYRVAAGKIQYSILAITMLQDITGESDVLLYTSLVDLFFIAGSMLSCFLILRMRMLTLLFSTATAANAILLILSACIYFQPANSAYFSWINSALLGLYFISITAGPYPVLEAMLIELVPLEIRSFGMFTFSLSSGVLLMLSIKLIEPMCLVIGYHGIFLVNILLMTITLIYYRFTLPETKGRTLQEVELFIKTGNFESQEQLLDRQAIKV